MVKQEVVECPPFYFGFWCQSRTRELTYEEQELFVQDIHTRVTQLLIDAYPTTNDTNNLEFFVELQLTYVRTQLELRDDRPSANMFVHFHANAIFNESEVIDTPNGLEVWDVSFMNLCSFEGFVSELKNNVGGIFYDMGPNSSIYPMEGWECEIKPKRKLIKQRKEAAEAAAKKKKANAAKGRRPNTATSDERSIVVADPDQTIRTGNVAASSKKPQQDPSKRIEAGLVMTIKDNNGDPELSGKTVIIIEKDPEKKGRWLVALEEEYYDNDFDEEPYMISVSGKHLARYEG